jgi:polysaccharide pyruvyl transferase WcaK-like protein
MSKKHNGVRALAATQSGVLDAPRRYEREARTGKRSKPIRIVLFGLFGCGNLGNDGSLEAMVDFLGGVRPDAELLCICDNPDLVARTHKIATLPISRSRHLKGFSRKLDRLFMKIPGKLVDLAQTFRHIRKADVMIVPGTGILDDFGERPYGMPLDVFRWCLAARMAGTRIAFVSIGAGPIGHRLSRWLMAAAARLAHYRSYRDTLSKNFMDGIGFDTGEDFIYPDIVFKLETPPATVPKREGSAGLTVGVGVMSYYGWYAFAEGGNAIFEAYIGKLSQFVIHLLDSGHDVRLLTGELADKTAVDALLEVVGEARPNIPNTRLAGRPLYSLHDIMSEISETDFVVATRFHNIVCALRMGRPTISLGYSRKNDVLMAEMGLGTYCQHVEKFDVDTLINQFSRLVADRETCERAIRDRTLEFAQQLEQQDRYLLSTLIASGGSSDESVIVQPA